MQFCRISAPFFHFEKLPFQPSSKAFIFFFFILLFSFAAVAAEHTHRRNPNSLKAMPEARDRRPTPLDVAAIYARRRTSLLGVLHDDLDPVLFGSTPRPSDTPREVTGSGSIRRAFGTPGNVFGRGRARSLHGSPALGVENTPLGTARRGRGRASSRSVLPSWYPRTPLRDITAIVRAIERRRARLGENEGQQAGNSFPADQLLPDPSVSVDGAHLEHGASVISPNKQVGFKFRTPAGSKVPKILLDIANPSEGESELTPQKKLLNSIDTVEKVVREELQKLKRTPSAKKAEREKRVRTLMSMR